MRFGICGSLVARQPDGTGVEVVEQARDAGCDYIELSLAHVAALDEAGFAALARRVGASGIACEACNNFFPRSVRLTGPEVDGDLVRAYVKAAVARAAELGVKVIVFGSAPAKNVPEGFPTYRAWQQIVTALHIAAEETSPRGITIAIEPINRQESNIVTSEAEGLALMRRVKHPGVQMLVDYYHMALEQEDPAILQEAGPALRHVHFAKVEGRVYPRAVEPAFDAFFKALAAAGYDGRVSLEAFSNDFCSDAAAALAVLRRLAAGSEG
jgi:D-psicose/D-tagatose/L-ribulose 3-epimerase